MNNFSRIHTPYPIRRSLSPHDDPSALSHKHAHWIKIFHQKIKLFRPKSMHLFWHHAKDPESTKFIQILQSHLSPKHYISFPKHILFPQYPRSPLLSRLRALSQQCLNLSIQASCRHHTSPKLIIINNLNQLLTNNTFFEIDSVLQTLQTIAIRLNLSVLLQHINYHPSFELEFLHEDHIKPDYFDNVIGIQQAFRQVCLPSHTIELILLKEHRERFFIDLSD